MAYLVGALLLASLVAWSYLREPSRPLEPQIVSDGIKSDPECFKLLALVAQRDSATLEAVRKYQNPVGLRCSNIDIVRIMKMNGAIFVSYRDNFDKSMSSKFWIKTKDKFLFGKPSKYGEYQFDEISIRADNFGEIKSVSSHSPYIT